MPFTDQFDGGPEVRHHFAPSLIGNAGRHRYGHELAPDPGRGSEAKRRAIATRLMPRRSISIACLNWAKGNRVRA
jgi:hypothetical protein